MSHIQKKKPYFPIEISAKSVILRNAKKMSNNEDSPIMSITSSMSVSSSSHPRRTSRSKRSGKKKHSHFPLEISLKMFNNGDSPMSISSSSPPRGTMGDIQSTMSSLTISHPVSSPVDSKHHRNQDVSTWSISDVVKYFEATDCSHIATIFREQEVDGEALLLLSLDLLVKCPGIKLKLGPALKVMSHVDKLKSGSF